MFGVRRIPVAWGGNMSDEGVVEISGSCLTTNVEAARVKLRRRWELASVLNFLHVFEPVIGGDLKLSAEEIETALIEPNDVLAQLHIALLKKIIPGSKTLNSPGAWMISLPRTLSKWWPRVAEGDFPLTACKGEEISGYKKLEPTTRLLILKALCEVRLDQHDAVSFINEKMKAGISSEFQKTKLAGDGNKTSFWYDGNETVGHRLYREINMDENEQAKHTGSMMSNCSQWETIATDLGEFKKVMEKYSSSEVKWEVALSKCLETSIIPVVEKHEKKKQRVLLRKQKENVLLTGFRFTGISRSCRSRKNIDYTFDNYDKAITEAILYANKRKTSNIEEEKASENGKGPGEMPHESSHDNKTYDEEDNPIEEFKNNESNLVPANLKRLRFSKRLAGIPCHAILLKP